MANAKDNWIKQSPKAMALGEALAYTFDFSAVGTPGSVASFKAYDSDGTDVSTGTLTGSTSITGDVVTGKKFTPISAENHRLECVVVISGNTVYSLLDVAVFDPSPSSTGIAVGASSYGTITGVASLVPKHANRAGTFDDTTRPTLQQVVNWIDEISSMLNIQLSTAGFTTPITTSSVIPALRNFVNQEVASMVEGVNGSGRFGPTSVGRRGAGSRYEIITDDVANFVEKNKIGFEREGATREYDLAAGIGFKDTDDSGDTIYPLFQREAFGETYRNWDE